MKVNLKKSTKTVLTIASLMIVLITTIIAVCTRQATTFKSSLTEEQIFENRVARNYNEFTPEDKDTNVANVKFASYFLRDLEGNNVAHMLDGTCKKIGTTDDLYFDIQVSGDSYIDNARISITNANFNARFNYLKDDYLTSSYKGVYSTIGFNRIEGGTEEQIFGSIELGSINNYNDYSKTAIITFTADYHDIYTGEVTPVEKQVPITVDWYGDVNTYVEAKSNSYGPNSITGNTVSTSFEIREYFDTTLREKTLLLKDRIIEIKVPNLRQWEPVTARLSDGNAVYNPETKTITLTTESTFDENGNCLSSIAKEASYTIYITYPEEAYQYTTLVGADDIFNGKEQLSCKTTVTTHAYNNQGAEFENIVSSENIVYPTIRFTPPHTEPAPLDTTVVVYYEHKNSEISIQKVLENYDGVRNDGIVANDITSYFDTHITVQRGTIRDFSLLKMDEDYIKFGQTDISRYLKDTKITYTGISAILEDDGKLLVYNAETDELIKEYEMVDIRKEKDINIPENVGRVRIELTNFKKCEGTTRRGTEIYAGKLADIYVHKTLDVNAMIRDFDYDTIKSYTGYYSKIAEELYRKNTGTLEYATSISDSSQLRYNKTEAGMSIFPATFGNTGEIDEDADEIGEEITFTVFSKHEQNRAYWGKGEFIVELPDEFNYFNLDSVESYTHEINGYEYFEENGKKLIRVFAETDARIMFKIQGHVLIDPTATNGSKAVRVYYKNEACLDFYNSTIADLYDVDMNGDRSERVGYFQTYVTITSPSVFIVKQTISNYDDSGAYVTAPNVAEADKEINSATIEIGVKNNNASPVADCYLVGKIPYEGNTKVKADIDLRSEYTTHMTSEGIIIPEDMENVVVYYSEKDDVNFDLADTSNGWTLKENVTDWNKVKSFLIDLSHITIRAGDEYRVFKYNISIPNGLSYNAVSYSTVASSYNLQTSAGMLYGRGTEAQKTGVRIARKYDIDATLYKETTTRVVPNESYVVEELDAQNNVVKTKMGRSDANGKLRIKNLYVERNYRIYQTEINNNYERDESVRYFRADENSEGNLVFSYTNNQSDFFNNTPNFTKDSETNKDVLNVSMWETPKYEIIINKLDRATEQPISGVNFMLYNDNMNIATQTGNDGKATIMKFSEGTNYTLEEVTAKGYYLQDTTLRLVKNAQYNYSVVIGNNEFVNSAVATNGGAQQDLATVELTLYNNAVPTYTLNVVKVAEGEQATPLAGAQFEITKYDDNEKETIITDENGTATAQNMYQYREGFDITGKYGLQETTAPHGYALNKEYIEFVVSKNADDTLKIEYRDADNLTTIKDTEIDGNVVTIYIQDKAMFKLTKTDDDQTLIPNVAFVIYELDANGEILDFARDANDEYIGTLNENGAYEVRTDANGEITIPIRDGDYRIFEVEAPEQYEYSTSGRRFRVKSEQESTTSTGSEETTEEKYTYQVQYYYNGQRDDSKTETYEVDPNTEVTTYVDKVQSGYELQYVTKLPYKIECDDLAIDVYYATPKTETLEINYIEDLIDLQIAVNNGNNFENTKVILNRSLDFNNNDSYRNYADETTYGDYNEDGTVQGIKAEVTSGRGWKSIGIKHGGVQRYVNSDYVLDENQNKVNPFGSTKLKYFAGTFDGNNNSISNMYINFSEGEAYKNEEDQYTTIYTSYGNTNENTYQDYYNAALFGWTHNATIMNLKFDASIYEGRKSNNSSTSRVSDGAGLVGSSYGSINVFNVENSLTGNFDYAGVVGQIYQRINTIDNENTNINIQDIKNEIDAKKTDVNSEVKDSAFCVGVIGYVDIPTMERNYDNQNVTYTPNPEIALNIEINSINNDLKGNGETNCSEWGVIARLIGHTSGSVFYSNDTCKMYSINSNIEGEKCGNYGAVVSYLNLMRIAEYKFNNIKSRVALEESGSLCGGMFGYIYPNGVPKFLIENFEVEMIGGNWSAQVGGVYGYASGSECTINVKNGKVTLNDVTAGGMSGGIIGSTFGYSVIISNVATYGKMRTSYECGSVIGYAASGNDSLIISIENANNYMELEGTSEQTGGIIGGIYGYPVKIKNTHNYAKISAGYYVGGIIGLGNASDNTAVELDNCSNMGEIRVNSYGAGGLIGYNYIGEVIIKNSYNEGDIKGEKLDQHSYTAGLVGYANGNKHATIINSYNKGNIIINSGSSTSYYVGGLVGQYAHIIQDSYNEGNISITGMAYNVGGIAGTTIGTIEEPGVINNVINKGKVYINATSSTNDGFGGIVGNNQNTIISNTINYGDVEIILGENGSYYAVGGIAGETTGDIYNAYNTGNVTLIGGKYTGNDWYGVGGIAGRSSSTISTCYNTGKIISMISAGGITGGNSGIIEDCYNEGKVSSYRERAGGIAGRNMGIITNAYNVGNVASRNADVKVGPVVSENSINTNGSGSGFSEAIIENTYYSDKVKVLGENVDYSGTKQQDDYMRTTDFYNTLNTNDVWTYINGQYPKLMISAGEEIPEAVELNIVNDHKAYTISTILNNPARGFITGYDQQYVEEVRHGEDNTQEIQMIPKPGYVIGKVTINGEQQEITVNDDGTYTISAGELTNIKDDIIIYVEFMKQDQILTITKVDKDTNEAVEGATFDIVQVESGSVDGAISGVKESEIENAYGADLNTVVDEVIEDPEMIKGSFTRIDDGFKFTSTFDYRSGSYYYYTMRTNVPIDLTNYTGEYIVRFESNLSAYNNPVVYDSNNQTVGNIQITTLPNGKRSYVYQLTGGEKYSIYLFFRKTGSNFTETVDNFHVYAATDTIYNMTTTDEGYIETTNGNIPGATSAGWIEVDLSKNIDCTMTMKHQSDSGSSNKFTMKITNMGTDAQVYSRQYYASTNEQTDTINLTGGEKYKVEFVYKNVSGGPMKIQIKELSLTLDETKLVSYRKTTNQDGEIKVQLPVGKYTITEVEAPEHYILNPEQTEYYVDIDKDNKVTIENDHKPRVRVHHYLMEDGQETTKKVAEDEEYEGEVDQDYYFNPKANLEGLSLAKDDNGEFIIPDNYKGKYALGITDINFYYEAEDIKLTIHHYLEGTQTKVAEDDVIVKDAVVEFKRDNSYTVSTTGTYKISENTKYQELVAGEYNLTSLYSSVQSGLVIDDTLEYSSNAELIYNYNTKKYRIVTRVIEHEEVVLDDETEDTTTTSDTQNDEINNGTDENNANTNTTDTANTTQNESEETTPNTKTVSVKGGTISGYDLEYYEELASNADSTKDIIATPDQGYKIKEIKLNDTVIYDADHTTSDLYTVTDGVVTFNKFNNVIEDKTITVEFEGIGSVVKVHHIITEVGKPDVEYKTVEIRGRIGSRYTTEEIEIEGYTLYATSLNTTGEIAEDEIDVYYNYKPNPETVYTIRYFYDEVEDTELAERITEKTKTTVTMEQIQAKIDEHKKDVYEFERAENIPLMIVNEVDEYVVKIFYISTYGKVTERHIDAGHNTLLYTETHKGSIGAGYNIQARNIEGYTLKTTDLDGNSILPTNAVGTYQKDVVDVVTYYYSRNTTVKVIYQDEKETELDKEIIEGHEGDEYTTEEKIIKGYELVEVPKNAEGVMKVTKDVDGNDNTETVVTYKYKKLVPADVVEKYVDVNTSEVVEEVIHKGEIDEEYEIVPKTIEGYTLLTKDEEGNDILPTNTKGKYTTEKVEVIYYVALNTTVRVQYINLITGEKMTDDVIIEGYEGKEYTTEAKTFEGYELTSTPEDAKGKMKVTLDEDGNKVTELAVKYYYAEILDGKLPQTSETNSKQAILIAIPFVVLINLALGVIAFKKDKKEEK